MKFLFRSLLFIISLTCATLSYSQDLPRYSTVNSPKNWRPFDLSTEIDTAYLEGMTFENLRILRNEIFARKGYRFSSKDLIDYFTEYEWYKAQYDANEVSKLLNDLDKVNIQTLSDYQATYSKGFEGYARSVPQIPLPFDFDCSKGFGPLKNSISAELLTRYSHNRGTLVGKLFEKENRIGLIYGYPADVFLPVLVIFDLKGKVLEKIQLLESMDCAGDRYFYTTAKGHISQQLEYHITRTVLQRDIEVEGAKYDTTYVERKLQFK